MRVAEAVTTVKEAAKTLKDKAAELAIKLFKDVDGDVAKAVALGEEMGFSGMVCKAYSDNRGAGNEAADIREAMVALQAKMQSADFVISKRLPVVLTKGFRMGLRS